MDDIQDIRSSPDLRRWIAAVAPHYIEELVAVGAEYERDAQGVWHPALLQYWLEEAGCSALAFAPGGDPVAFAFLGLQSFPFRRQQTQYVLAEFWVAPERRRSGTGGAFARSLFARFPGAWELTVLPANTSALAFWRAVIPARQEIVAADGIDFVFECPLVGTP
ncbi:MAG TPA: GNAT family N-acetyltransferase [Thermoanaerobaculia bacterium]|nr:GNAT family N-acetyltransferase [Thermoanaerobaculia bacterium]